MRPDSIMTQIFTNMMNPLDYALVKDGSNVSTNFNTSHNIAIV